MDGTAAVSSGCVGTSRFHFRRAVEPLLSTRTRRALRSTRSDLNQGATRCWRSARPARADRRKGRQSAPAQTMGMAARAHLRCRRRDLSSLRRPDATRFVIPEGVMGGSSYESRRHHAVTRGARAWSARTACRATETPSARAVALGVSGGLKSANRTPPPGGALRAVREAR